jgi:hypothetical protein
VAIEHAFARDPERDCSQDRTVLRVEWPSGSAPGFPDGIASSSLLSPAPCRQPKKGGFRQSDQLVSTRK